MSPRALPVRTTITVAVLLAAALTVACGGDEEPDYSGDATAAPARPVALTANDFSFSPAEITAETGGSFDVVLTNGGDAPHTFTIDEFDVHAEVAAGAEMTVSVTPSGSGDFAFYCRFHKDQGMEGDITISRAGGAADSGPTESPPDDGDATDPDPTDPPADPYYDY